MLEECTIGTSIRGGLLCPALVSVVVRRMYYWDRLAMRRFSAGGSVSVVVRRMYYWDVRSIAELKSSPEFQ